MTRPSGMKAVLLLLGYIFAIHIAEAQQPKKIQRIGYLAGTDAARESNRAAAIRQGLRDLGYIEGQNIVIEYGFAEGKPDRFAEVAADLVRLKVDVIVVTGGGVMVEAAKNATKTIPIVMLGQGADPVEAGLVESLAHPGGNVTGITNINRELIGKRLELLKEAVPKLARIAYLYDPSRVDTRRIKDVQTAARVLGLTPRFWEVGSTDAFETVFTALMKERPDGLQVAGGPFNLC